MHPANVAVLILNWNRREDTLRCLDSLDSGDYPSADVIVIDNASEDDSVEAIHRNHPNVRIIRNSRNLGYAAGNNVGLKFALDRNYDYVVVLNNDTVVAPNTIRLMIETAEEDPSIGIVGPAIPYLGSPDLIWSVGGKIDWKHGEVISTFYDQPLSSLPVSSFEVAHVTGCCMLLRSDAIRRAGLLDPRFFMYYEETEWCVRITRSGYRAVVNPAAVVWHDIDPHGQLGSKNVAYYMTRNRLLFLRATRAPLRAWIHTLAAQLRTVVALFIRPTSRARMRGRMPMVFALRDFLLGRYGAAAPGR